MGAVHPLIVTLAIDATAQRHFDELRRTWFPAGRTVIGAHITLFHALPGAREPQVLQTLAAAAQRPPFDLEVLAPMSLGRGVAYRLASAELGAIHANLASHFADGLTPQDAQPFRPHITVQNKVSAETARATLEVLRAGFVPHPVRATGLVLWRYLDGPWEPVRRLDFAAP